MNTRFGVATTFALGIGLSALTVAFSATAAPMVPPGQRGDPAYERQGMLDAGGIRTLFSNFGLIGDHPSNPTSVDLSLFHSVEAPKGSGMNYVDGITPFLLARVVPPVGGPFYIMETGYRDRQAVDPGDGHILRLEPRPGFFQPDPGINLEQSPAVSDDPRTWPPSWPDKLDDPSDPGWPGRWNGFFSDGRLAAQESFVVMDDQAYTAWPQFVPDSLDATRRGLALRYEVRSLQWTLPGGRYAMFWHYDITNEGTTPYEDNLFFGMYTDAGVGSSMLSCDNLFELDDDNASWERDPTHNLAYAWDRNGHGVDLSGACATTGYVGWSFLQTPGDAGNGIDDDLDGLVDEQQEGGPGVLVFGRDQIRAYFVAHADTACFRARYGSLEDRPAYIAGSWWTGDEDLDWSAAADDVGADGVPGTHDSGEGDAQPGTGEPDFDGSDPQEVDQLGLTGFKMNRIHRGPGNIDPLPPDGITFANLDNKDWPRLLFEHFTDPDPAARFDSAVADNWNIAYLAACGPFSLQPGQTVRFSLALAHSGTLPGLRQQVIAARDIHEGDYFHGPLDVSGPPAGRRPEAVLIGGAPNPFSGVTRVRFVLSSPARVSLRVMDLQGRTVAAREAGSFAPGEGGLTFDGSGLPPGLYLYRLELRDGDGGPPRSSLPGKLVVLD